MVHKNPLLFSHEAQNNNNISVSVVCLVTNPSRKMKKNISRVIKYVMLLCVAIFLGKVFLPRQYDIPLQQKRAGTQYWHLSSGSDIGYTVVTAKGVKKPFPVIYLHGGPGGAVSESAIQSLCAVADDGYDVYFYDQVGSGQSNRLENINEYTPSRHVSDLKEIAEKIGAQKVILIGQSWGAILAVLFAAQNADKVEKIIFTSPGPVYPYRPELANRKAPDSFHLSAPYYSNAEGNKKANNIRTKTMAFCAAWCGKKLATDEEADAFATYLSYEVNKSVVCDTTKVLPPEAGSGYYAGVMTFHNLLQIRDPRPKIKNTTIPVLVMKGQCDNQLWGFTCEYLDLFPNHQLVIIPDAGHAISIEQPELYIKTIRDFLNR
jgi:proline iminopeptidase